MAFTFSAEGIGARVYVGAGAPVAMSFLVIVPEIKPVVLPGTMAA